MADARSLLSAARQTRRITHPYARYTDSNKLFCSLCEVAIKAESQWNAHLKTSEHAKRALRAAEAANARGRKRKAGAEDEEEEGRKRVRGTSEEVTPTPGSGAGEVGEENEREAGPVQDVEQEAVWTREEGMQTGPAVGSARGKAEKVHIEDDPEWLALQKMLNAPPVEDARQEVYANATISAAPMSADELAAKAREEQSTQRGRRELELEEEKEDAQEALQAEFDEMDELEERVKKLREKREALRKGSATVEMEEAGGIKDAIVVATVDGIVDAGAMGEAAVQIQHDDEDEDDDDDDADLDDWNFGGD